MGWDFAWTADPAAWIGLGTLVLLEIVLGIDNLVFISILSSRLPEHERRRAFNTGLGLALLMRLALLSVIAWVVGLTEPWFSVWGHVFSARDTILIIGGLFLLLKGTTELHERLEGPLPDARRNTRHAVLWQVIAQIVALDAIFSLDSVITSVGMVKEVPVMMLAVIVAVAVMLLASRPLTRFVDRHPTVIILCLGFLLMIGLSLIMDGLGFHVPKGYLYAAIVFSGLVEGCNQLALRNRRRRLSSRNLREATAETVLKLLGGKNAHDGSTHMELAALAGRCEGTNIFEPDERDMVARAIRFGGKSARHVMTPRRKVERLDPDAAPEDIMHLAATARHVRLPVLRDGADDIPGVVDLREVVLKAHTDTAFDVTALIRPVPVVFEHTPLPDLLELFRIEETSLAVVVDEYGAAAGIVTPRDVLLALVGPAAAACPSAHDTSREDDSRLMPGRLPTDEVLSLLDLPSEETGTSATLAGLLLEWLGRIPACGESVHRLGYVWTVEAMDGLRIDLVRVRPEADVPLEHGVPDTEKKELFPKPVGKTGVSSPVPSDAAPSPSKRQAG